MRRNDLVIGFAIVGGVLFLVLPLPAPLIDFMLMLVICGAIIIFLTALFAKEALEMSMFPTIILIATLFRMAMSVATTRSILLTGYAGHVIEEFGGFVAGGALVVGVIIFFMLALNFLAITKGSERVAEVTARFTLDAMPCKQMAIDADLSTGLINEEEAKQRRKKIRDESNFHGAMDGAVKFVKGDAIFSIMVVFVNIIGGIILGTTGMATGVTMPIGEATGLFMPLTIGAGLASQIPALLIAVAAGLIVTKATA